MPMMRGHGEGTIVFRPGRTNPKLGRLMAVVSAGARRPSAMCPHADHRTRDKDRPCPEVVGLLAHLKAVHAAGTDDPRRLRLGPYLERWVIRVAGLAPATIRQHEMIVRVHLTQAPLARRSLHDLRPSDVEGYLARTDLDPQTRRHHRATLRRALADALRDGLVSRNVAALAKPPLLPRRERPVLDLAQVGRLIDSTRGDRLHALWVLGATCGLREAEALGLAWSDVDLETGILHVRYTLHYDPHAPDRWQRRPPKTAKSRRTINLPAETVRALRAHELIQADEIGDAPQPIDNLVFTTAEGMPIHGSNILPPLYLALRKAGLPRVTFHDLRHSAATVLYAAGVPLPVISDILGHSTIRVTNDLYRHRVPELSRDAAQRMDAALERVLLTTSVDHAGRGLD